MRGGFEAVARYIGPENGRPGFFSRPGAAPGRPGFGCGPLESKDRIGPPGEDGAPRPFDTGLTGEGFNPTLHDPGADVRPFCREGLRCS